MKIVVRFAIFFAASFSMLYAQDFKWQQTIKKQKGIIRVLNDDIAVIAIVNKEHERYISAQLPLNWRQESLHVVFTGKVGEIPPNYRMMGTPLRLMCIMTSKEEAKQFNIKKRKLKFK